MSVLSDPEQVMRDYLAQPRFVTSSHEEPPGSGWRAETGTGGLDARPETIQILKTRALDARRLYAVTFEDTRGRHMLFYCHIAQDTDGDWRFEGGAGGGTRDGGPHRGHPWIKLGGGGWPRRFYAGGAVVEDDGQTVARARLRAANGVTVEDRSEDGIALFLTDDTVTLPVETELLDATGAIVSRHVGLR